MQWSALKKSLPANVHMLTLEQWSTTSSIEPIEIPQILIRFEHIYEKDEDPVLSQPAVVDLVRISTRDSVKIYMLLIQNVSSQKNH